MLFYLLSIIINFNFLNAERIDDYKTKLNGEIKILTEIIKSPTTPAEIKKKITLRLIEAQNDLNFINTSFKLTNNSQIRTNNNQTKGTNLVVGEMYCYPNPAKCRNPTLHIEAEDGDGVDITIHDGVGRIVERLSIEGKPQIIMKNNKQVYGYELEWGVSKQGSGVYIVNVLIKKANKVIKGNFKCAVIR